MQHSADGALTAQESTVPQVGEELSAAHRQDSCQRTSALQLRGYIMTARIQGAAVRDKPMQKSRATGKRGDGNNVGALRRLLDQG